MLALGFQTRQTARAGRPTPSADKNISVHAKTGEFGGDQRKLLGLIQNLSPKQLIFILRLALIPT